jgi:D-proline reductase (dithiol) PrdB
MSTDKDSEHLSFPGRFRTRVRRLKNILTARLAGRWPALADRLAALYRPLSSKNVPWAPVQKKLAESTIAIVTTAGVHHRHQEPFDMNDPDGDPSCRILDPATIESDYKITHDYYDHRDADRDINIVFPIGRLREMKSSGFIGGISKRHFSFMGHITGRHIPDLIEKQAPRIAEMILEDRVDAVLLTPG